MIETYTHRFMPNCRQVFADDLTDGDRRTPSVSVTLKSPNNSPYLPLVHTSDNQC